MFFFLGRLTNFSLDQPGKVSNSVNLTILLVYLTEKKSKCLINNIE